MTTSFVLQKPLRNRSSIKIVPRPVATTTDIENAIELRSPLRRNGGLLLPPDGTTISHRSLLIDTGGPAPNSGGLRVRYLCRGGGLMSYGTDQVEHVQAGGGRCRPHPTWRQTC